MKDPFIILSLLFGLAGCYKSPGSLPDGEDTGRDFVAPELDMVQDTQDFRPDVPLDVPPDVPFDVPFDDPPYEPFCGNGVVEGAEQCDDANNWAGDGCEPDCTFTCVADGDCADGDECNGRERCEPGSYTCMPGIPMPDGFVCEADPRSICIAGTCYESTCGDGFIDTGAGEMCEPPGVGGCDAGCELLCTGDSDCPDDGNPCNGEEYCNLTINWCERTEFPPDGAVCVEDPRSICVDLVCHVSSCGDGFVDSAAGEECDDDNAVPGDGCEPDCTYTCVEDADCPPEEHCETALHVCQPL